MSRVNTIYIIDDDPITVFGIRKMLTALGVPGDISSFENGEAAFRSIENRVSDGKSLPEVIFLDINMPIMDGWQFLDSFFKISCPHPIRINIVTSSIDPIDLEKFNWYKSRTSHILEYRNKPIRLSDLEEITRAA